MFRDAVSANNSIITLTFVDYSVGTRERGKEKEEKRVALYVIKKVNA